MAASSSDSITLPRYVVYFQGALLGIVAATSFVFGMMVGTLTGDLEFDDSLASECRVTGVVLADDGSPDAGAVVLMLPVEGEIPQRTDPRPLRPDTFEPLNNPAIDLIHRVGGAVSRVDDRGRFDVIVDAPQRVWLITISASDNAAGEASLSRPELAGLSRYFLPVESLLYGKRYSIEVIDVRGKSLDLGKLSK